MKVYPDRLEALLDKGVAPIYLVHGDEPLQAGEITDRLHEKGLIHDPMGKAKSVTLTAEGLAHAEKTRDDLFGKSKAG